MPSFQCTKWLSVICTRHKMGNTWRLQSLLETCRGKVSHLVSLYNFGPTKRTKKLQLVRVDILIYSQMTRPHVLALIHALHPTGTTIYTHCSPIPPCCESLLCINMLLSTFFTMLTASFSAAVKHLLTYSLTMLHFVMTIILLVLKDALCNNWSPEFILQTNRRQRITTVTTSCC